MSEHPIGRSMRIARKQRVIISELVFALEKIAVSTGLEEPDGFNEYDTDYGSVYGDGVDDGHCDLALIARAALTKYKEGK